MPRVEINMPEAEAKKFLEDAQAQTEVDGLTMAVEEIKESEIEKKGKGIIIKGEFSEVILDSKDLEKIKKLL